MSRKHPKFGIYRKLVVKSSLDSKEEEVDTSFWQFASPKIVQRKNANERKFSRTSCPKNGSCDLSWTSFRNCQNIAVFVRAVSFVPKREFAIWRLVAVSKSFFKSSFFFKNLNLKAPFLSFGRETTGLVGAMSIGVAKLGFASGSVCGISDAGSWIGRWKYIWGTWVEWVWSEIKFIIYLKILAFRFPSLSHF